MTPYWQKQMAHAPTKHYYEALKHIVQQLKYHDRNLNRVLEIGTGWGISGSVFLEAGCSQLVTIDPNIHARYVQESLSELKTKCGKNQSLIYFGIFSDNLDEAFFIKRDIVPWFSVIFVDGRHDYESVKADLERSHELLMDNGIIICDDYTHPKNNSGEYGVAKAVDEYCELYAGEIRSVHIDETGNGLIAIEHSAVIHE